MQFAKVPTPLFLQFDLQSLPWKDKTDDEATAIQDKKGIPRAVDEAIEEDSEGTRPFKKIRKTADKTKAIQDKNEILKTADDETKAIIPEKKEIPKTADEKTKGNNSGQE